MFWNGKDELDKRLARLTKINAWRWLFCLNITFSDSTTLFTIILYTAS